MRAPSRVTTALCAMIAVLFLNDVAQAGRSVTLPAYWRRIVFSFYANRNFAPPPDGTTLGAIMSVKIILTNVSGVKQTGRIELMDGMQATAIEPLRSLVSDHKILNCADTKTVGTPSSRPGPASFTLDPYASRTYEVTTIMKSTYSAAGPSGHTLFDATFSPIIKIAIDQDRGAVLGVMVPTWDLPIPGFPLCDGATMGFAVPVGYIDVSEGRTGVPLPVNGGRAF